MTYVMIWLGYLVLIISFLFSHNALIGWITGAYAILILLFGFISTVL
ncbi:MAG: hypothetical protein OH335_04850 [Candidatus Parvarchaeota archaeon]|nr:hypothetical protein [Candidatus Jingweiarchaeum tengchongense]MCW1306075.1 hypothetical protein [Candidatus Jingweiarchaeum tengchongense]